MKKLIYGLVTLSMFAFSGCAPEENVNAASSLGEWTLDRTTYSAYRVYPDGGANKVIAHTNSASSENLSFLFNSLPTSNGTYNIREFGFFAPAPAPGEVTILASGGSKNYGSLDHGHGTATVTIVSGKLRIAFSNTYMVNVSNPLDTVFLAANIKEGNN